MPPIPFVLAISASLLAFHSPRSHNISMLTGLRSLVALLQRQLLWVYLGMQCKGHNFRRHT